MILGVRDVDQALRAHLRGELRRLLQHFLPRKKLTLKGLELHAHNEHPEVLLPNGKCFGGIPSLFRSVNCIATAMSAGSLSEVSLSADYLPLVQT